MEIGNDKGATIIALKLDIIRHEIEALPPHVEYTNALNAVTLARDAVSEGRADLYQQDMKRRYQKT